MATRINDDMRKRHLKLFNHLADYFDPELDKQEYDKFLNSCRVHLTPIAVKKSPNLIEALHNLERKSVVAIGKYDKLKTIVEDLDATLSNDIKEAEEDIARFQQQASTSGAGPQLKDSAGQPSNSVPNLDVHSISSAGSALQHQPTESVDMPSAPKLRRESKTMRDRQGSDKESKNEGRNQEVTENRGGRKRSRQESSDLSRRALTKAQKQKIHCKMVTKLSKELGRNMKNWEIFENNMKYLLNFGENELSEITNMFDACKKMAAKGDITIGEDYDKLIEVVEDVDNKLVKIIEEHLEEMGIEPSPERKRRRTRSSEDSL